MDSAKSAIAIDTETNYTDDYEQRYCLGISFATLSGAFYIPLAHKPFMGREQENCTILVSDFPNLLVDISAPVVFHNAKFDLEVLEQLGLGLPKEEYIYCTMLMHHYIQEQVLGTKKPHALETVAKKYSTVKKNTALAKAMKEHWEDSWIPAMAQYATEDTLATREIFYALLPLFEPYRDCWEKVDREFMYLLKNIEQKGIPLDREKCQEFELLCRKRMDEVVEQLGFKPTDRELQKRLFGEPPIGAGLKPTKMNKTGPSTDAKSLEAIAHPIAALALEYRGNQKQASSYYANYLSLSEVSGRLHPTFKQHGTVTGRLSCENPNLQQIPRESEVKSMFLPEPGCELWEIDFKNLELRLAAVYSKCEALLSAFHNEEDVHQMVADDIGIPRHLAKVVNFLVTYGGGVPALSYQAGISVSEAQKVKRQYEDAYPEIFICARQAQAAAESNGNRIRMWSGRYRHFIWPGECHKAFNAIVQGGGFEIVKRAMLFLERDGRFDIRNQVHDSVWLNVRDNTLIPEAERIMSEWTKETFGLMFSVESKCLRKSAELVTSTGK